MALAAIGGSTNAVVHLLAIAGRAGVPLTLDDFDVTGAKVPLLVDLQPAGAHLMEDFHRAGGLLAVLREVRDLLDPTALTVTGRPLVDHLDDAPIWDTEVIRSRSAPLAAEGGIAVLRGNLAPEAFARSESAMVRSRGHCNTMGTASTMALVAEALGTVVPGVAGTPAPDSRLLEAAHETGRLAVELVASGRRPRSFLTRASFHNAIVALAAIGGSTNAVVHLLAIAGRAGVPLTLDDHHHHDHDHDHGHGLKHYHDEEMQSLSLRTQKPLDPNLFMPWLQNLMATEGQKILRSKGILAFQDDEDRYVFQGVHMMLEGDHQRKWKDDEPRESRVVFIGRELPEQMIRDGFERCIVS